MTVIETPRLILRPFERRDIDELASLNASPVVTQFQGGFRPYQETKKSLEQLIDWTKKFGWIEEPLFGTWVAHHKADNKCIGEGGLRIIEIDKKTEVEIHGKLARAYWGLGLASEVAKAIRDYAFFEIGLNRLTARVRPKNKASIKVVRDIFMEYEKEINSECHLYAVHTLCWLDDPRAKHFQNLAAAL